MCVVLRVSLFSEPRSTQLEERMGASLQLENVFMQCNVSFWFSVLFFFFPIPYLFLPSSHGMVKTEYGIGAICCFKEEVKAPSELFLAVPAIRLFPLEPHSVSL